MAIQPSPASCCASILRPPARARARACLLACLQTYPPSPSLSMTFNLRSIFYGQNIQNFHLPTPTDNFASRQLDWSRFFIKMHRNFGRRRRRRERRTTIGAAQRRRPVDAKLAAAKVISVRNCMQSGVGVLASVNDGRRRFSKAKATVSRRKIERRFSFFDSSFSDCKQARARRRRSTLCCSSTASSGRQRRSRISFARRS